MSKTEIERILEILESVTADLDADCGDAGCPDCVQWRPIWGLAEQLRDAVGKKPLQITHAEGCWSWGPAHYECACNEVSKLRGWTK